MAALQFHIFPYMSDNYGVLIHEPDTGRTACVDAGEDAAVMGALAEKGWTLTDLFITHHHWDHTDGLLSVKEKTGCTVWGPKHQSTAINGLDHLLEEGDQFDFAGHSVSVLQTPGHTTDMINFHFADDGVIFTGDTLFSLGCGRISEGTPAMMWDSLSKFLSLPPETTVYSSHEYTLANANFALTVDPENEKLKQRAADVARKRENGEFTVPSTLKEELETNPFLRAADPAIRRHLGMETATDAEVFAEIRKRKDNA